MSTTTEKKSWRLVGANGLVYRSDRPGSLGGHRRSRIYGRLDCPAALRALAKGGYRRSRVFFADASAALAAGYRPCAVCMPAEYTQWRAIRKITGPDRSHAR